MSSRPHILLVIPRGEAVRNFLYSDTLKALKEHARVTVLSVVYDTDLLNRIKPHSDEIIELKEYQAHPIPAYLRTVIENAHDRWLWSKVAQNNWELRDRRAQQQGRRLQRAVIKVSSRLLANNPCLHALSSLERYLHWKLRGTREFDDLLHRLKPDLVFNGSHIHGFAGELPLRVAHRMGIKTAGFIFSWDNLTSRSRILVPYDYWFVWHEFMKKQLLGIYPRIHEQNVFVTGTPQFDFHFKPEYLLSREELCRRIGIDPARPFILYTTGVDRHFPEEHRHVRFVIDALQELQVAPRPQLVVRTYVKGTSPEMKAIAQEKHPDVVFPPVAWDARWFTPAHEDLGVYTSLVHHATLSINAASTVTLEFFLKDKPVINLDFDPPGSLLAPCDGFHRHICFDHFRPVAQSGGSMVARSKEELARMIREGLMKPSLGTANRERFMKTMFNGTLDGQCGRRVAATLLNLAVA